jgi:hypothetical protein
MGGSWIGIRRLTYNKNARNVFVARDSNSGAKVLDNIQTDCSFSA